MGSIKHLWFLAVLLVVSVAWAADPSDSWTWNAPNPPQIPGVVHGTIESGSMKRTVGYNIYLPPDYEKETERRYPVVYFLHGAGGTESSDVGLAYQVHEQVKAGVIEPVIYVFPNGGKTSGYRDHPQANIKSETLILRELMPHIDKNYRTIAKPESRGICGFSMGGGGALRLMLKHPDLFGAAASLAAAIDEKPDANGGDNVYQHASKLDPAKREKIRLYMVIGDEDFLYKRHPPFLQHLKELKIPSTLVVHSKVGHNLGVLNKLSATEMIRHMARELKSQKVE